MQIIFYLTDSIGVNIIGRNMNSISPPGVHCWLILLKAYQAVARYSALGLAESGLGESDFRVLEVLLHKGALPVNVIGPKVNLTPGSISVAVDRLYCRGLVSRVEDQGDRRIRVVALTPAGRDLIESVFQRHAEAMEELFAPLSSEERLEFERQLKTVGRRAEQIPESK